MRVLRVAYACVTTAAYLLIPSQPVQGTLIVGMAEKGDGGIHGAEQEFDALRDTLQELGFTVVHKTAGDFSGIDVYISSVYNTTIPDPFSPLHGPTRDQIAAGVNYIQLAEWGNWWTPLDKVEGATEFQVHLRVESSHSLTTGVDPTWTSFLSLHNAPAAQEALIAWSTDAILPSLVGEYLPGSAGGNPRVLVADEIGSGRAVHIGWSVYGPDADRNDLLVLRNSVEWAATGRVTPIPEPSTLVLRGIGISRLAGSGFLRRPSPRRPIHQPARRRRS